MVMTQLQCIIRAQYFNFFLHCVDTGDFCKKKWKALRDYYYKIKKTMKGKSGKPGGAKKPWVYFAAMDRVLSCIFEENEKWVASFYKKL